MSIICRSSIFRCLVFLVLFTDVSIAGPGNTEKFRTPNFRVIAFYKATGDQAHTSFVHEANRWFAKMSVVNNFTYDSTDEWDNMNTEFLSGYQIVIFLNARPETGPQREAFEKFVRSGGAWLGFHFSAFTLNGTEFPQNWDWYHNTFLGSGEYSGNTWRPTSATLRVDADDIPCVKNLPKTFVSTPNEWYRWKNDLRKNPDIRILLSIDSSSFPLGTGPKPQEIWHDGYYPVVWTNKNYKMLYVNMGHNDIDYEHNTNADLSQTFASKDMENLVLDGLYWLAGKDRKVLPLQKKSLFRRSKS
jgi:uncharacterized protein